MGYKRHHNLVIKRHGARCHYCGAQPGAHELTLDHFRPRAKGGSDNPRNLVPSCKRCNSVKKARLLADARWSMLQKILGWPRFTQEQLDWLRSRGFDLSELDGARFQFEAESVSRASYAGE
jgi:5-methylcytosine-specific restriction endonuclease McrA